ncbi:MAG: molybdate ABC transporter substrate-binding protein [Epsilonproteobacteria bacterium]|nr:MAG: molybdate ABC transporter substrate-binding protein [Campylobacterota bacterium]
MKKLLFLFMFIISTLNAAAINIAVAANVSYAIEDLKKEFKKSYPNTEINVILGSSGKLTAQITNGAPYMLFMSANMKYPQVLYKNKIAITKPIVYAEGSLVMLSVKKQDFSKGLNLLLDEKIKTVAIANPKTAPYGIVAREALKNVKIYETLKSKFVYGESISQTVAYTNTAADIGLIAKSALYSSKMSRYKRGINWVEVNPKYYTPIEQGVVLLKDAKDSSEAKAFYDFLQSEKAKKIFIDFGYVVK